MKSKLFVISSVGVTLAACSSSIDTPAAGTAVVSDELVECPSMSALDSQQRAAATIAFNVMMHSASLTATMPMDADVKVATAALASQRYRIPSSGVGIEWDPADPLYKYVTDDMKADLAFGQLDETVAQYLSDGLRYTMATTDGLWYPSIPAIPALAGFTYPEPSSTAIPDSRAASHTATVRGEAWCQAELVTIDETVVKSWGFAPLYRDQVQQWRTSAPFGYASGGSNRPNTPFNGPSPWGNPYLVVAVNDASTNWANYDFTPASCWQMPDATCAGQIQIDPVPYAEPGDYYNAFGLVGTRENPFVLFDSVLTAEPAHISKWATRTVNSTPEFGQFLTPITLFGRTQYKYVKQY